MSEVICNTSPLQYFYQLGMLHVFQALAGHIIVLPAVVLPQFLVAGLLVPRDQMAAALEWISYVFPLTLFVIRPVSWSWTTKRAGVPLALKNVVSVTDSLKVSLSTTPPGQVIVDTPEFV